MTSRFRAVLAVVGVVIAAPVGAHHSLQAQFDVNKLLTLKGLITKVEWVTPHVYLYLDVTDGHGTVRKWALETLGTAKLRRGGITKQMLGVGQNVTVVAYHAKDGLNLGFVRKITFPDDRTVEIWIGDPAKAP